MADDPNLTTTDDNPFAEWAKKFEQNNNERMNRQEAALQGIAQRTSWLPNPGQQAPPEPENVFVNPDRAIEQRIEQYVQKNVAPAMLAALQSGHASQRFLAKQQAAADPSVAEVFKHFGPDVEKELNSSVLPASQADPQYWIKAAKIIKADKGDELAKLKLTSADIHTEGAGQRGAPATADVTELPAEHREAALRVGVDPDDPDTLKRFNNLRQMQRRTA